MDEFLKQLQIILLRVHQVVDEEIFLLKIIVLQIQALKKIEKYLMFLS